MVAKNRDLLLQIMTYPMKGHRTDRVDLYLNHLLIDGSLDCDLSRSRSTVTPSIFPLTKICRFWDRLPAAPPENGWSLPVRRHRPIVPCKQENERKLFFSITSFRTCRREAMKRSLNKIAGFGGGSYRRIRRKKKHRSRPRSRSAYAQRGDQIPT